MACPPAPAPRHPNEHHAFTVGQQADPDVLCAAEEREAVHRRYVPATVPGETVVKRRAVRIAHNERARISSFRVAERCVGAQDDAVLRDGVRVPGGLLSATVVWTPSECVAHEPIEPCIPLTLRWVGIARIPFTQLLANRGRDCFEAVRESSAQNRERKKLPLGFDKPEPVSVQIGGSAVHGRLRSKIPKDALLNRLGTRTWSATGNTAWCGFA